ncbi:MAG TPA: hypothetical protein VFX30_09970 [bacterium]|nr:hypothetical protein [bacterium]
MGETTWNPDIKAMDAEIATLITNSLGTPDDAYPSRELSVSNEFIKRHPEFEEHRTEVYVAYLRVYARMKEEGKFATPPAVSSSILVRPSPEKTPLRTLERFVSNNEARELLRKPPSTKNARPLPQEPEKSGDSDANWRMRILEAKIHGRFDWRLDWVVPKVDTAPQKK